MDAEQMADFGTCLLSLFETMLDKPFWEF